MSIVAKSKQWWRVNLSEKQEGAIKKEAEALIRVHGENAQALALKEAKRHRRAHDTRRGRFYSRVAGCVEAMQK